MVYVAPHQKAVETLRLEITKRKYEIEELEKAIAALQPAVSTTATTTFNPFQTTTTVPFICT